MSDHVSESETNHTAKPVSWQLNALTEALGDLTLTVSDRLSVGRGSDNDVVLGSKAISRNHAVLSVLNDALYIKDLASSNGTFINDKRIESDQSVLLRADDTLSFASFDFQVIAPVADIAGSTHAHTEDLAAASENKDIEHIVGAVQEDIETDNAVEPVDASQPAAKETPIAQDASAVEPLSVESEPVVKETIVTQVLSASDSAAVDDNNAAATPIKSAPAVDEPVMDQPVVDAPVTKESVTKEPTAPKTEESFVKEPVAHAPITEGQDKTTTTALQEEADPEVLRAKQAATAQFSGTANLGQGRDLGTTGNNAMDQTIDNPASRAQSEKKSSGGWFIWVFVALIIIGLALWLFNMGGA